MEGNGQKSIKELPFEERVDRFKRLVQGIGIGVGGDEEYDLRHLGSLIVEYHGLEGVEEKEKFKEEKISPMYDKLGGSGKTNPKVGEAIVNVVMAEMNFF